MQRFSSALLKTSDISLKTTNGSTTNQSNENDPLVETSDIIYENYRRQKLEGKLRVRLIFCISSLLAICAIIVISVLQYDEYFALINDRQDYIANSQSFCNMIQLSNIDIVSTPIAGFLIFLYIIIYRRRVFLRNKYKYRNLGLPMIVSCWNKVILK